MFLKAFLSTVFLCLAYAIAGPAHEQTARQVIPSNYTCYVWIPILKDIQTGLLAAGGPEVVRQAVRLAFHDAFSPSLAAAGVAGALGGTDGSIVTFSDVELTYHANLGLADIVAEIAQLSLAHPEVSVGDLVQFVSAVGLASIPGGPRVSFFGGRPDAKGPAPDTLVPQPFDTVDSILNHFGDAGFSAAEVVHLLAAHSFGNQEFVDTSAAGAPFDSTPGVFDPQFFLEVLLRGTSFTGSGGNEGEVQGPIPGEFRLQSDAELSRDSRTACTWQSQVSSHSALVSNFVAAHNKLSVVGQNVDELTDCSEIIPVAVQTNGGKDFAAEFPAGTNSKDIEQSCAEAEFPTTLVTVTGPTATLAPAF